MRRQGGSQKVYLMIKPELDHTGNGLLVCYY